MSSRHVALLALSAGLIVSAGAQGGAPSTAQPGITTIQAKTNIVVVDVVVTDRSGNHVHGLKPSDFSLLENGKPQTVAHFEDHAEPVTGAHLSAMPKLNPGTFTNLTPAPVTGGLNVLLLDSLNTPIDTQAFVHAEVLRYLKNPHQGTRMAIFTMGQALHLLQGFTSDPEVLRQAVNRKSGPQGSVLMNDATTGDAPGGEDPMASLASAMGNDPSASTMLALEAQFQAEQKSFQTQLRVRYTIAALNQLARYLSGLPGRKNLIWFSGSFPVTILPTSGTRDPFANGEGFEDEFRQTTNLLSRSQVAVYPVDARGLQGSPVFDSVNIGAGNSTKFGADQSEFSSKTADEHSTMLLMADQTGGHAYLNTNGLSEAVDKAVDNGSNFYSLTYTPTDHDWKGDFRKIQVALASRGYTLSYRRGYYADAPGVAVRRGGLPGAEATALVKHNAMQSALQFGAPDPTQIIFQASVSPTFAVNEDVLAANNKPGMQVAGPYRRYSVLIAADPKDIDFTVTPEGNHHAALEFVTIVYDTEGKIVNSIANRINADLNAERYAEVRHAGVQVRQEISVPARGKYVLRVGVRDIAADKVGAIEIAVAALAKLPPLSTQPAPATRAAPATKKP